QDTIGPRLIDDVVPARARVFPCTVARRPMLDRRSPATGGNCMADLDHGSYWRNAQARRINRRRTLAGGATFLTGGIALGLLGCSSSNNTSNKNANNTAGT